MQNKFKQIAVDEINSLCEKLPGKCPDQYVGEIAQICYQNGEFNPKDKVRKEFDRDDIKEVECIRTPMRSYVILILESPHVYEFKDKKIKGPAQGPTGTNIRIHLMEILNHKKILGHNLKDKYQGYGLILMNAIQYQCSLGMPTEYFRDKIFCQLWKDGGESNFKERLKGTFQENDVLINCCTTGAEKRNLVTQSIRDISPKLGIEYLITGSHPSFWSVDKNRCEDKFKHIALPINSR